MPARRQVSRLYYEALARPAGERAAFLAAACAGDDPLRREVQTLLDQLASAQGLLAAPTAGAVADLIAPTTRHRRRDLRVLLTG